MAEMKVEKILSNNAVLLSNSKQEEIVAIGRGIGFGKKAGDVIDNSQIESQFIKKSEGLADVLSQLLSEIPPAYRAIRR
ncbi:CAT RNA binding domain-containing protein [Raoultella sp. T31]|uniref:CAT RNA binding domain-containing protein n=1 Tax=Raoultella sp. T31 TaxID=2054594 RepID=UPI003A4E60E6